MSEDFEKWHIEKFRPWEGATNLAYKRMRQEGWDARGIEDAKPSPCGVEGHTMATWVGDICCKEVTEYEGSGHNPQCKGLSNYCSTCRAVEDALLTLAKSQCGGCKAGIPVYSLAG